MRLPWLPRTQLRYGSRVHHPDRVPYSELIVPVRFMSQALMNMKWQSPMAAEPNHGKISKYICTHHHNLQYDLLLPPLGDNVISPSGPHWRKQCDVWSIPQQIYSSIGSGTSVLAPSGNRNLDVRLSYKTHLQKSPGSCKVTVMTTAHKDSP